MAFFKKNAVRPFDVEHHACLFGWFSRQALNRYGEKGRAAVLEGVRRYGEGRGQRMAERARVAGYALDIVGLLAFSEIDTSCNRLSYVQATPYLEVQALECAWQKAWQKAGLLKFGCLYCQQVDVSIVKGFNPEFAFEVDGTLTNGAPYCTFRYLGGGLGLMNGLRLEQCKKKIGSSALRPYSFHVEDLYRVMAQTLIEHFGENGRQSVKAVRETFVRVYGVPPSPEEDL